MQKQHLIIIGNGMVGHHFVEQLAANEYFCITVICAEQYPAYDRVHLSDFFAGKTVHDLALGTAQQYVELGVNLLLNDAATHIDRSNKTVSTASGAVLMYDKLVLATGSYPFVPPVQGGDHARCFVYRTLDDLDAIRACAKTAKRGVVVGGGLLVWRRLMRCAIWGWKHT